MPASNKKTNETGVEHWFGKLKPYVYPFSISIPHHHYSISTVGSHLFFLFLFVLIPVQTCDVDIDETSVEHWFSKLKPHVYPFSILIPHRHYSISTCCSHRFFSLSICSDPGSNLRCSHRWRRTRHPLHFRPDCWVRLLYSINFFPFQLLLYFFKPSIDWIVESKFFLICLYV